MANSQTAELILKLVDEVTAPAGRVDAALATLDRNLRRGAGTGRGAPTVSTFWEGESRRLSRAMAGINNLSIPTSIAGIWGAKTVYQIEEQLNDLEARTFGKDATLTISPGVQLDRDTFRRGVTDEVNKLNAILPLDAGEILGAWNSLAQAGLSYEQVKGVLPGALDYAVAASVDAGTATTDLTDMASQFRLPLQTQAEAQASIARLSDLIGFAANASKASPDDFAQAFKYAAPAAAALGLTPEYLAAMFGTMADSGIRGSEAGVAVRSMLTRMVRPTKGEVAALAGYGIDLNDYVARARPIGAADIKNAMAAAGLNVAPVMGAIADVLAGDMTSTEQRAKLTGLIAGKLGDKSALGADGIAEILNDVLFSNVDELDVDRLITDMRNAHISTADIFRIFDQKQGVRALTLLRGNLQRYLDEIDEGAPGFTASQRDTHMQGIVKAWNQLDSSLTDLVTSIGKSGVVDDASSFFSTLARGVDWMAKAEPLWLRIGTYGGLAVAILGPLGFALKGLASALTLLLAPVKYVAEFLKIGVVAGAGGEGAGVGALLGGGLKLGGGALGAWLMSTEQLGNDDKLLRDAVPDYEASIRKYQTAKEIFGKDRPWILSKAPGTVAAEQSVRDQWGSILAPLTSMADSGGKNAGVRLGQGMAQGVLAEQPNFLGQLMITLGLAQKVADRGLHVPLIVDGPGVGSSMSAVTRKASFAGAAPVTVHNTNTFHIHGADDPQRVARVVTASLDEKLQRSRELSMEDRVSYG